jgi:hypothetical protein
LTLAVQTRRGRSAIVNAMPRNQPAPPKPAALQSFVEAVVALSDDPGPDNLQRYLAASRELEESRPTRERARSRTKSAATPRARLQGTADKAA